MVTGVVGFGGDVDVYAFSAGAGQLKVRLDLAPAWYGWSWQDPTYWQTDLKAKVKLLSATATLNEWTSASGLLQGDLDPFTLSAAVRCAVWAFACGGGLL